MRPVQVILALLLLFILVLYFSRLRSSVLDRLVVVVFSILGISMIIAPDWTNWAANLVGVGRGADLLIYLAIVGFGFVILLFYSKIKALDASITDLARSVAIERAVGSSGSEPKRPDPEEGKSDQSRDEPV